MNRRKPKPSHAWTGWPIRAFGRFVEQSEVFWEYKYNSVNWASMWPLRTGSMTSTKQDHRTGMELGTMRANEKLPKGMVGSET